MDYLLYTTLRLNGFPIDKARKKLKEVIEDRTRNHRPGQFNASQLKDAFGIYRFHRDANPFYQKLLSSKGGGPPDGVISYDEWRKVPIMRKKDMQVDLQERIAWLNGQKLHFHSTSGSSGIPFHFARDKFGHAMIWALTDQRFKSLGLDYGRSFQARFYGIPMERRKYYTQRLKDRLSGRYRFTVDDLSDGRLEKITEEFGRKKFEFVYGYASAMTLFARFLLRKGIVLKDICPTLRLAITASEVCDDLDREAIRKAYGVPVVNEYGAAELDLIAIEDADGDWLVNNETLLVEILDENDEPCPPGKEGRFIITSLFNKAMPFIRYEVGDRGIWSDREKGHYRLLDKVVGRSIDFARTPSGKVAGGMWLYYIGKNMLLKSSVFIREFMIVQKRIDAFELHYSADRDLEEADRRLFMETLEQYLEPGLSCEFFRYDSLERTRAGKLTHFRSELPKESTG
jgi:phenylacetate-CoA ligase